MTVRLLAAAAVVVGCAHVGAGSAAGTTEIALTSDPPLVAVLPTLPAEPTLDQPLDGIPKPADDTTEPEPDADPSASASPSPSPPPTDSGGEPEPVTGEDGATPAPTESPTEPTPSAEPPASAAEPVPSDAAAGTEIDEEPVSEPDASETGAVEPVAPDPEPVPAPIPVDPTIVEPEATDGAAAPTLPLEPAPVPDSTAVAPVPRPSDASVESAVVATVVTPPPRASKVSAPLPAPAGPPEDEACEADRADGTAQSAHDASSVMTPAVPALLPWARLPSAPPEPSNDAAAVTGPLSAIEHTAVTGAGLALVGQRVSAVSVAADFARASGGWAGPLVFNVWLRRQLRERRMSQRKLALLAGLNHSAISRLVNGHASPTLETATKLVHALRMEWSDDQIATYFDLLPERTLPPTQRVESALRGDGTLGESEVRAIMRHYLTLRAIRKRAIRANGDAGLAEDEFPPAPGSPDRVRPAASPAPRAPRPGPGRRTAANAAPRPD